MTARTYVASEVVKLVGTGNTQRFHTEAGVLLKTQDVGQHCYGVFWLLYTLTKGHASRELLVAGMAHDAGERWVGDVPSPTKRALEFRPKLHEYEEAQLKRHTGFVTEKLFTTDELTLKLCDNLDGALFCAREASLGNRTIGLMLSNFVEYVAESHRPLRDTGCIDDELVDGLINYLEAQYERVNG